MKKHNLKVISFIVILALMLSASVTTTFAIPAPPAAEVVYRYGSSSLQSSDFEGSVSQVINEQISNAAISTKTITFANLLSTEANAADVNAWTIYGHGDIQWPSSYPGGGGVFTPPADKQHIGVSSDGTSMTFYGYTTTAFNDFMIYKNDVSGEKTFNFTLDRSKIYYHSMLGGGFLFNATTSGITLNGYLVLFTQNNITLYQLNNVNINDLHEGTQGSLTGTTGVTSINTASISADNLLNVEVVVTEDNKLNLTSNGNLAFDNYSLPTVYGNLFGPFASFSGHGCGDVSIFGFQNLEMSIETMQYFTESLHEYDWRDTLYKFFVNVDDDSADYGSNPTAAAMIADLDNDNIYYIGVGVATNEAISQQFLRTSKGIYITIPNAGVYDEIGELIANDLITYYKLSDLTATAGNQIVTLDFTPPQGALDGDITVEQSTDGAIFTPSAIDTPVTSTSSATVVTDLVNGQEYWFRLHIESGKYAGYSNIVTATPKAEIPRGNSNKSATVIVNGQSQRAGTQTVTMSNGNRTITVDVNENTISNRIDSILNQNGTNDTSENVIEIPVGSSAGDSVHVGLTGDLVKKMEEDSFILQVTSNNISYLIPSEDIKISDVADELGSGDDLENIEIKVKIIKPSEDTMAQITAEANAQDFEIVFPPVSFEIMAVNRTTNEEVTVDKFNNYVRRMLEIPAGVDPSKITTGIVYNSDGTFSHVPTEIIFIDGKYYAKLNSLTNSTYSVVYNPITVASVENHWSKAAVNDMASRLVIKNPETFDPDAKITRGEFAEYITKAVGVYRSGIAADNIFTDVTKNNELADAIKTAVDYGIIKGYSDGSFKPDVTISRQEAMVMYSRAMNITKLVGKDTNRFNNYTDYSSVSEWAKENVKQVIAAKVFNGVSDTKLAPKSYLTKAEAATAIRNLLTESKLI